MIEDYNEIKKVYPVTTGHSHTENHSNFLQQAQTLCIKLKASKTLHRCEGEHKVPLLAEKLLVFDRFCTSPGQVLHLGGKVFGQHKVDSVG